MLLRSVEYTVLFVLYAINNALMTKKRVQRSRVDLFLSMVGLRIFQLIDTEDRFSEFEMQGYELHIIFRESKMNYWPMHQVFCVYGDQELTRDHVLPEIRSILKINNRSTWSPFKLTVTSKTYVTIHHQPVNSNLLFTQFPRHFIEEKQLPEKREQRCQKFT